MKPGSFANDVCIISEVYENEILPKGKKAWSTFRLSLVLASVRAIQQDNISRETERRLQKRRYSNVRQDSAGKRRLLMKNRNFQAPLEGTLLWLSTSNLYLCEVAAHHSKVSANDVPKGFIQKRHIDKALEP